jgi:hypothetical protein
MAEIWENIAKKIGFMLTYTWICDKKLWLRDGKPLQNKGELDIMY